MDWTDEPATRRQLKSLKELGYTLDHRLTKIEAADHWFAAYGAGGIFVARLLPGIRHVISIPAGLFEMNFRTFSIMTTPVGDQGPGHHHRRLQ